MAKGFVQLQTQYLAGSGARIGDTTVTLRSFRRIDGTEITDMTIFGSEGNATIEPGSSREEAIIFTGITNNADGTTTLTGVSSQLMELPYTETVGITKPHAGGVPFVISNTAGMYKEFISATDDYELTGRFDFTEENPRFSKDTNSDGNPDLPTRKDELTTKFYVDEKDDEKFNKTGGTLSGDLDMDGNKIEQLANPTEQDDAANKAYVDDVAVAGAPNASTSVQGLVQEATQAEVDNGTDVGSTGAKLFVSPSNIPDPLPPNIQTFTSSGTWTKPDDLSFITVEVIGAGGGGSGSRDWDNVSSEGNQCTAGGTGGYAKKILYPSDLGSTETVTRGLGGNSLSGTSTAGTGGSSSFTVTNGSNIIAHGGTGGTNYGSYGVGGSATGGDINLIGGSGCIAPSNERAPRTQHIFGGTTYGSGGASATPTNSGDRTGEPGKRGVVIITEYFQ